MVNSTRLPRSILIANRGEIAIRIARTCKALGIESIAVHSVADRKSLHVQHCDRAIQLTGPSQAAGYLDAAQIITAATQAGADAIHPGYGFLSENAEFASACAEANLTFIGPSADVIGQMGDKIAAKTIADRAGVPTVPGLSDESEEGEDRDTRLIVAAKDLSFPLLIKASAGGGGRGMRIVDNADGLADAIASARRESKTAFGSDRLLVERYIANPRHVEVQIFGDKHGNAVHLFERDCSVQRRHQKIVEEAPAPGLRDETRANLYRAALALAKETNYDNAGTVEFILDAETQEFFFLEVNTRLQVEHPVTEEILGLDLVDWQIRVASGQPLPLSQDDLVPNGWAMEVRLTAENAARNFMPQTGTLARVIVPSGHGVRFDGGVSDGSEVTPFYDSMLAKVIVHGKDRETAIRKLDSALSDTSLMGVKTNTPFLRAVLNNESFTAGSHTTHLVAQMTEWQTPADDKADMVAAMLTGLLDHDEAPSSSPWRSLGGWRGGTEAAWQARSPIVVFDDADNRLAYWVQLADRDAVLAPMDDNDAADTTISFTKTNGRLHIGAVGPERSYFTFIERHPNGGQRIYVDCGQGPRAYHRPQGLAAWRQETKSDASAASAILAPGPGTISSIAVAAGDKVKSGAAVVVIESMKMLQTLTAPRAVEIAEVLCEPGQSVVKDDVLVTFKTSDSDAKT
ncbi:MAG: biotin carboxylase N-terminal domain-containing protein [Pseudomonadota bacterium]